LRGPGRSFAFLIPSLLLLTPSPRIGVLIPAHNEVISIGLVLGEIPAGLAQEVVVADNASPDATAARAAGATVLAEPRPGYGQACLAGLAYYAAQSAGRTPDIIVFLDGDHSDFPEQMPALLAPILSGQAELVIGSRALGQRERGALLPQQRFGNWLATRLLRLRYGGTHTDHAQAGHPGRCAGSPGHGGYHLRLDGGNAAKSRPPGPARGRSACALPPPHRHLQNIGHGARHAGRGLQNSVDDFQILVEAA